MDGHEPKPVATRRCHPGSVRDLSDTHVGGRNGPPQNGRVDPAARVPLTADQVALLDRRYGPARRRPVGLLVAVGLVVVALAAWLVWAGLLAANPPVRWELTGYSQVTDRSVVASFTVTKSADDDVVCTVQARDFDNQEVGRADVPISGPQTRVDVDYRLSVIARPTTVEVLTCVVAPPTPATGAPSG